MGTSRSTPRGDWRRRSPFADVAVVSAVAVVFGLATAVWITAGDRLPGGRWLAVHLFTLGVLTNVVVAFSRHFGRTVTRAPDDGGRWHAAVLNVGVVLVLVGIPSGSTWATALGSTAVTVVIADALVDLRRMRRRAVGARFAWIARVYEHAHAAFVLGAVLGLLLGVGLLPGRWYGAGRVAHLHLTVLGWAGLTVLATIVFFGPTMVRTRIEDGADARAAVALRYGAAGLAVAAALLLAVGVGGVGGDVARMLAAAALGVYAGVVGVVCAPVLRAARGAKRSATRPALLALCVWFPLAAWIDVAVVATGRLRLLDAVGLAVLAGVLGQAVVATLVYLVPALRGRTNAERSRLMARLTRGATTRTAVYNAGVVAVTGAALAGPAAAGTGALVAAAGWSLVLAVLAVSVVAALWPLGRPEGRPA